MEQGKTIKPITNIIYVWMVCLLLLAILQKCKLLFGFHIWPLGEDRNWLKFMLDGHGKKMMNLYWSANDRNPLSAWWWFAVSKLIHYSNWGLYIVRKFVDPFVAISSFLLLDQLSRKQCRTFVFSVALIILMWNFSNYFEQIIWEFIVALGFTLLSIYFYCRFLDQNRKGNNLAIALICYLVAITTYTLQSGAIIAVTLLAFFRNRSTRTMKTRLITTLQDAGLFTLVFVIYNCIWYTVSTSNASSYKLNWHLFLNQFTSSFSQFIFHPSYHAFWVLAWQDWSAKIILGILAAGFITFLLIFFVLPTNKILSDNAKAPFGWIVAVLLAIALPTLIVESTSNIWAPGTRSLMIQQVWQPLLYVSGIFLFVQAFWFLNNEIKKKMALILVSLLGSVTLLFNLYYNHRLVLRTHYQMALANGIKKLNLPENIYILVKPTTNDSDINSIPPTISSYGETMLKQKISLRLISYYENPGLKQFWRTQFKSNKEGAINVGPFGKIDPVPYYQLAILFFDGKKVWKPSILHKQDFEGFQVDWDRDQPIYQ